MRRDMLADWDSGPEDGALCLQRRLVIEARDEHGLIERLTGSA